MRWLLKYSGTMIEYWTRYGQFKAINYVHVPTEECHRLDGPAVVFADGSEMWFKDGLIHRVDGPAMIDIDGAIMYYLYGKYLGSEVIFWLDENDIDLRTEEGQLAFVLQWA